VGVAVLSWWGGSHGFSGGSSRGGCGGGVGEWCPGWGSGIRSQLLVVISPVSFPFFSERITFKRMLSYTLSMTAEIYKKIIETESTFRASRKIYYCFPCAAFPEHWMDEFNIINEVSIFFNIPFNSVKIIGSAKTGFSIIHDHDFIDGISDLDIALINVDLYMNLLEYVYEITDTFRDYTNWNKHDHLRLKQTIAKGYIDPAALPSGHLKDEYDHFFSELSSKYFKKFSKIWGFVYINEKIFELKQMKILDAFKEGRIF